MICHKPRQSSTLVKHYSKLTQLLPLAYFLHQWWQTARTPHLSFITGQGSMSTREGELILEKVWIALNSAWFMLVHQGHASCGALIPGAIGLFLQPLGLFPAYARLQSCHGASRFQEWIILCCKPPIFRTRSGIVRDRWICTAWETIWFSREREWMKTCYSWRKSGTSSYGQLR